MIVIVGKNIKKIFPVALTVLACAVLLSSQSLVEIAKKEKERRAALKAKGLTAIVVTNADLRKPTRLLVTTVQSQAVPSQDRNQSKQSTTSRPSAKTSSREEAAGSDQNHDVFGYRKNATKVIFSSGAVKNPERALRRPDGQFAMIPELGVLDLEFIAKNGPGADIAIYGRMAGHKEAGPGENEEGGMPDRPMSADPQEGFWYGVLGMNGDGEWKEMGKGNGITSPEEFDLGDLSDIKKIRIMFKPHNNAAIAAKLNRLTYQENTFEIDAVEALH